MLHEGVRDIARHQPHLLPAMALHWLAGKARFKAWLARHARVEPAALPYHAEVLAWAREEARNHPVCLTTGTHIAVARQIADHLGFFSDVIATDSLNLVGQRKARALVERFGVRGFDYAGDSAHDLQVWPLTGCCKLRFWTMNSHGWNCGDD
jgi:hypothetical protein